MRILDGLKIKYEVKTYDDDVEHYLEKVLPSDFLKNSDLMQNVFLKP